MHEAVIVDAVRTPIGRRRGLLSDQHPASLAALTLNALSSRTGLDPRFVEDVIMGCVIQVGEQGLNIGRNAVLAAGWPESVPATSIDRQCGSSQQAVHFAAQGVMAGAYDIVVAAGVEVMSRVPMDASQRYEELGTAYPAEMLERYATTGLPGQGLGAESIAAEYGISRTALDEFALESHRRADTATREGRFLREIVEVPLTEGSTMAVDEGIRPWSTLEQLGKLKPAFKEDGVVTAANSSQISDGASAVLIMRRETAEEMGLPVRARLRRFAVAATDPVSVLKGPIPATSRLLESCGIAINDIDLFEVNEAFASVVLAWQQEFGVDLEKVNVNGGAIALGHPLGCSGARILTTLLHELERTDSTLGLQTICEAGGMANALLIERMA